MRLKGGITNERKEKTGQTSAHLCGIDHTDHPMLLILTIGKGVFGYSTEPLLIMVAAIAAFIAFRVVLPGMR